MSSYATRDQLISLCSRRYEVVVIGETSLRVQSLTELERMQLEFDATDDKGKVDKSRLLLSRARMIAKSVVDGDGKRVFSDSDAELIADSMDTETVTKIHDACDHLRGEESIEETVKNSRETPGEDSQLN